MTLQRFIFRSPMPASAEAVLEWHGRPGAFERLSPPWESVRVLERNGGIEDGGRAPPHGRTCLELWQTVKKWW